VKSASQWRAPIGFIQTALSECGAAAPTSLTPAAQPKSFRCASALANGCQRGPAGGIRAGQRARDPRHLQWADDHQSGAWTGQTVSIRFLPSSRSFRFESAEGEEIKLLTVQGIEKDHLIGTFPAHLPLPIGFQFALPSLRVCFYEVCKVRKSETLHEARKKTPRHHLLRLYKNSFLPVKRKKQVMFPSNIAFIEFHAKINNLL